MFFLETEYFAWNVVSWTANFLLAALVIFVVVRLKKPVDFFFIESEACAEGEREFFSARLERYLGLFRVTFVEICLFRPWARVAAPLFFLLLFLMAVYAQ